MSSTSEEVAEAEPSPMTQAELGGVSGGRRISAEACVQLSMGARMAWAGAGTPPLAASSNVQQTA